jgi:hypothetical protein
VNWLHFGYLRSGRLQKPLYLQGLFVAVAVLEGWCSIQLSEIAFLEIPLSFTFTLEPV